jgi:hypothetical protein
MADNKVRQILQEVDVLQCPEWKNIGDRSTVYGRKWAQLNSLVERDGVLKRHWESADGRTKTSQRVLPRSKVREVLAEIHGRP